MIRCVVLHTRNEVVLAGFNCELADTLERGECSK